MWLAWRNGACLVPAPRALVRSGMDLGPWLVAQGITVVSTVPTLAVAVAGRRPGRRPAADLRRRGLPARARRAAGRSPTARSGTPTAPPRPPWSPAGRGSTGRGPGRGSACPSTAGTSPSSTPTASGRRGRGRRADHRRRRPGPLPRPGHATQNGSRRCRAWAGPGLPQRRPRPLRPRGPACSSAAPTTRSSSAAGGSSSARWMPRCRRCPASPVRPRPCARRPVGHQILVGYLAPAAGAELDLAAAIERLSRRVLPAALVPRSRRDRRDPDAARRARSTVTPCRGRCRGVPSGAARHHLEGTAAWVAGAVDPDARVPASAARTTTSSTTAAAACRRPSWSSAAARPLPRGHGRRRLRQPAAGRPRRPPRRVLARGRVGDRAGAPGAADRASGFRRCYRSRWRR